MNELALFAGAGGESSQDICSGGEPCVPLKSKTIHAEFYCNGKLMDSYLDSLYGTTSEHLMANLGEEECKSSQEDSLVRTYQQQEKAQDLKESDQDFGEKWHGSFAKYDPDTHSLRTPQCSLFEDSTEYCATLPRWGLMRDGECWEQRMLEQTIRGTESGLSEQTWPTPLASDWKARGPNSKQQGLREKVKAFPTPTAHNAKECASPSEYNRNTPTLATHAGGKLNPTWVEWLMGWPLEWTDLKPLEMGRCLYARLPLGESLQETEP